MYEHRCRNMGKWTSVVCRIGLKISTIYLRIAVVVQNEKLNATLCIPR